MSGLRTDIVAELIARNRLNAGPRNTKYAGGNTKYACGNTKYAGGNASAAAFSR